MKLLQLHILLSTLTFGVLCVAALQATLLTIQDYLLRHKSYSVLNRLPALQSMETGLFRAIGLGFLLLTMVLITSWFTFTHLLLPLLWQKTLLSSFAWLVFMVLLLGRYYFGWRGKLAIRWTFSGVFLVVLIYGVEVYYAY